MKRVHFAALTILALTTGCGGAGKSNVPNTPPLIASSSLGSQPIGQAFSEAQSDAMRRSQSLAAVVNSHLLYVGNIGNNSITVYHNSATGNTAPLYVIIGSKTGISSPGQLSQDAQGNLYVANGNSAYFGTHPSAHPAILVFAHGANGNVAPIRALSGSVTGIRNVAAMTVDQATGKIFVAANNFGPGDSSSLLRFPPNATGNEAPFAIGAISFWASELASGSSGQTIIDAHEPACCFAASAGVETYVKQFANNETLNTLFNVQGLIDEGVAEDPTTKTYLVTNENGIYRLAENTVGNGPDIAPPNWVPAPISVITNDTCGGQLAVAQGLTPDTYVVHNAAQCGSKYDAVYVYAQNASGNAKPLRVLSGSSTLMSGAYGIYEGM